jgi:LacI family transcriptional regulator
MPVTIYEVAKKAGVGIGTVSRVLNNSAQISPATRAKVLKVIKQLNFQPHALAQGLARRKNHTIGVIVPFFTGYFYVELLRGIQHALTEQEFDLVLYGVDDLHKKEACFKRVLQQRRVDGVLLLSLQITEAFADEFERRQLPLVLVDMFHPRFDSITVNNEEGAYQAVKHLINIGRRKIAMVNGHGECVPARERLSGFRRAMGDAGLPVPPVYLMSSDAFQGEAVGRNDGFNKEAGYRAMQELLALNGDGPDAVFAASDVHALGVMSAAREHGLSIPEDLAVVGFDDVELAELVGLSTVRQPICEMGKLAVDRLLAKVNGNAEAATIHHRFTTQLVVRGTSGREASAIVSSSLLGEPS